MSLEIPQKSFALKKPVLFGQIDFVNCLPITLPFLANKPANLELVMDSPGGLNRAYARGEIALGAMSAHYFLEDGQFKLFDRLCIASRGAVASVLFFSRKPLDKLPGSRIALSRSSATSNNLVKVLLAEQYGSGCRDYLSSIEFVEGVDATPDDSRFDGCVIIGDNALAADNNVARGQVGHLLIRKDLGQWWFELFQLPMVFGVWAARKTWAEANASDFECLNNLLFQSLTNGLGSDYESVMAEAMRRTGLGCRVLDSYFRTELDYTFSSDHHLGLEKFRLLCQKYGLL